MIFIVLSPLWLYLVVRLAASAVVRSVLEFREMKKRTTTTTGNKQRKENG